jgi:hypothetical protein
VKITETIGTIAFAAVAAVIFNCRTRFSCGSRINTGSKVYRLPHEKPLVLLCLRQLRQSFLTAANQLSHVCLRQCGSPVLYRDYCPDRRSAAVARRGVTQPSSTARIAVGSLPPQTLKLEGEAELKARSAQRAQRTDIPYWRVSAVRS